MTYDALLNPFQVKGLTLPNRVVMAPMTRSFSPGNVPGADVAAYYARRAQHRVGLIITEGTVVAPKNGHAYPNVPDFAGKAALDGWRQVVDRVHAAGGKIFPQLWHCGSVRQPGMPPDPDQPGMGPAAILHPSMKSGTPPTVMTEADIADVVDAFAVAALNARDIGFDGVEIHGAHGYLIDQFFWDATNRRTDGYGGAHSWERTRFAVEIVRQMRQLVGDEFPICLRFSQWKMGDFEARLAHTPKELERFLAPLADAGVDLFHCSTRRFWEAEFEVDSLNLAGWTRKLTGKPTITVGSVGLDTDFLAALIKGDPGHSSDAHLSTLLESLEREDYDLVAVGRALLADPAWVTKVVDGRIDQVIPFTKESLNTLS
ncbi:MAG: NADH:flavin oxidoreductase [Desulfosarcina sp.]|nr:NADH:flavin oxidoreductase [Desulfosarcina sp.]MBC2743767.1 NADH:flavin oxidoreductase [Desulfosarcina sp.]MBC2766676.1 NADH:flavin oxidoreductase [Desulfosarcina sp.]